MAATAEKDAKSFEARAKVILSVDYFVVLGLARTATSEEVQKAFFEAVKTWHPDRVPAGLEQLRPVFAQVFGRLDSARATLSDPARRAHYIEELARPTTRASASDMANAEAMLEFKKAEAVLKRNDLALAEQHLLRAIQLAPANVAIQTLLVSVRAKPSSTNEQLKDLIVELDDIIARDPRCTRAHFVRGQLRKRLGNTRDSNADFERTVELDPHNIDAAREVRLYKIRKGTDPNAGTSKKTKTNPGVSDNNDGGGIGGFFKKLLKR